MKTIGVFTIDEMGRIMIPSELRNMLGWEKGSKISMFHADNNTAILQPSKEPAIRTCDICDEGDSVIMIKGHKICADCVGHINALGKFKGVHTNPAK